jgi:hypothetical protein
MVRITIRYDDNRDVPFLQILNFLVAYKIIAFETAVSLHNEFRSGGDIVLDVPDEIASRFRGELDHFDCKYD